MKKILFLLLLFPELVFAQDCNCPKDYQWLKNYFEKNDAGFQLTIDNKGIDAYKLFCDSIEKIVAKTDNLRDCKKVLDNWTKFFRKGHIGVELSENAQPDDTIVKIRNRVKYTTDDIKNNIRAHIGNTDLQGIWKTKNYTIGIIKDSAHLSRNYVGFIIDSKYPEWEKGMVKLEIFNSENETFKCNYYMYDFAQSKFSMELKNKNQINIGTDFLALYKPDVFTDKTDSLDIELLNMQYPYFAELTNETVLLRIPSFAYYQKDLINDVIKKHFKELTTHPNLIIDLRNNGGGTDGAYAKIIPLLYTHPIKTVNLEFLSTPANNNYLYENNNSSFLTRLLIKKYVKKLNNHLGEFVNILGKDTLITTFKKVYDNPAHIYIMINENCASSAEQFLLAAKQSKKVKLIGRNTFGALDVSNVASAVSPDSLLILYYSVSKTLRSPKEYIDGKGIEPDIPIEHSIYDYQWLRYTMDIISNHNSLNLDL